MAFDYEAMRNMAAGLLTEFGGPFSLLKRTDVTEFDEDTMTELPVYEEHPGKCVKKMYSAEQIGIGIIKAGDVSFVCTMDDETVTPTESMDRILYKGIEYNIISVQTSDPSGQKVIVHTCHCRRVN